MCHRREKNLWGKNSRNRDFVFQSHHLPVVSACLPACLLFFVVENFGSKSDLREGVCYFITRMIRYTWYIHPTKDVSWVRISPISHKLLSGVRAGDVINSCDMCSCSSILQHFMVTGEPRRSQLRIRRDSTNSKVYSFVGCVSYSPFSTAVP